MGDGLQTTLEFVKDMDPHSLKFYRKGKFVGYVQWHPDQPDRIVIANKMTHITFEEVGECWTRMEQERTCGDIPRP